MRVVTPSLRLAIDRFDPFSRALAVGRTLIAVSQLLVLLANPDPLLFVDTVEHPTGLRCDGPAAVSLWCLGGGSAQGAAVGRAVVVAVLLVVAAGYRPRWTCVPHWYAAFSLTAAMPLANGGDRIGQIAALLFIPLCLGDDRVWQWSRPSAPAAPWWRGSAFAAHLVLRVQLCVVYLAAVVSKLGDPAWRRGSALHVVFADPRFGVPLGVRRALSPVLESYWVIAGLSWGVVLVQVVLAAAVLGGPRARSVALWLGLGLHLGIAVVLSLPAFGLVMIGMLVVGRASGRTGRRDAVTIGGRDDGRRGRAVPTG